MTFIKAFILVAILAPAVVFDVDPAFAAVSEYRTDAHSPDRAIASAQGRSEADRLMQLYNPSVFNQLTTGSVTSSARGPGSVAPSPSSSSEKPCVLQSSSNIAQLRAITQFSTNQKLELSDGVYRPSTSQPQFVKASTRAFAANTSISVNAGKQANGLLDSIRRYQDSPEVDQAIRILERKNCPKPTSKSRDCVSYVKRALRLSGLAEPFSSQLRIKGETGSERLGKSLEDQGYRNLRDTEYAPWTYDPRNAPRGAVLVYADTTGTGRGGHVEVRTDNGFASQFCDSRPVTEHSTGGNFELVGVYIKPM
jgi:hypothetical protein